MIEDKKTAAIAKLRHLRIAPRKVRQVADLIRGKRVIDAQVVLQFLPQKSGLPLIKLLKSATASAKNNFQLKEQDLYISKLTVDEGPKLKRWRARARGQAYEIQKKTSHITLALNTFEKKPEIIRKPKREKKKEVIGEKAEEKEKVLKAEKPKLRPEKEKLKPERGKGIRRIFRRKSF